MTTKYGIGERLRYARERKGYQQKFVASKLDIQNSTLSKIERGIHEPDSQKLRILADLYEVSVEWILFGTIDEAKKITAIELRVLRLFNSLSDEGKELCLKTLEMLNKS